MNKHSIHVVVLALNLIALVSCSSGQDAGGYLDYTPPQNAVKVGPIGTRHPDEVLYQYLLPQADGQKVLVGRETYRGTNLIGRELFKDGERHGVQRQWHTNGTMASKAPYKENDARHF